MTAKDSEAALDWQGQEYTVLAPSWKPFIGTSRPFQTTGSLGFEKARLNDGEHTDIASDSGYASTVATVPTDLTMVIESVAAEISAWLPRALSAEHIKALRSRLPSIIEDFSRMIGVEQPKDHCSSLKRVTHQYKW